MNDKNRLVLASASPRRKELLALMGIPFEARPGTFVEPKRNHQSAQNYVMALAAAKADYVETHPNEIILSGDTIVEIEGEILGKPADPVEAEQTLNKLRAKPHFVYTAVNVQDVSADKTLQAICKTVVHMRDWTAEEQAAYIRTGNYADKAGGYAIQDHDFHPVSHLEGCYANVMGLPLCHLYRLLEQFDFPLTNNLPEACQNHIGTDCQYYAAVLDRLEC